MQEDGLRRAVSLQLLVTGAGDVQLQDLIYAQSMECGAEEQARLAAINPPRGSRARHTHACVLLTLTWGGKHLLQIYLCH